MPSPYFILLRVLLSLSLILNGSEYAVAATQMQMGRVMATPVPQSAADPVASAEASCHEHHHSAASAALLPGDASNRAPLKSKIPGPDCCKSGVCSSACEHQAQTVVSAYAWLYPLLQHAGVVRGMASGHVTPLLSHLIRPPIG